MSNVTVETYENFMGEPRFSLKGDWCDKILTRAEATALRDSLSVALTEHVEPDDATTEPCPFHGSGNTGACNHCEDQ